MKSAAGEAGALAMAARVRPVVRLRLFVSPTPGGRQARRAIEALCEEGRKADQEEVYEVTVLDVHKDADATAQARILATPLLECTRLDAGGRPLLTRRFVGDFGDIALLRRLMKHEVQADWVTEPSAGA